MALLERRSVVSVLLFPLGFDTKPYRVLLFRRSAKVSTYQKKLAPIAGSIEHDDKSPLDAAWRELKEETGLGPQHIELWRRGPGFEFTDETAISGKDGRGEKRGRIWKVWPFAFRFKKELVDESNNVDTSVLKIDWEHLNCEWNKVEDILSGEILNDCVPRLEVTLGQVWVDPASDLYQGLETLRLDHSHGARELATTAVNALIKIVESDQQNGKPGTPEQVRQWWKNFRLQAFHLAFNGRPSMGAAISSAVVNGLKDAQIYINAGDPNVLHNVSQSLQRYVKKRGDISGRLSGHFSMFLQDKFGSSSRDQEDRRAVKILTLSSSSTIKAALLYALDTDETRLIELRVLESRPLFEGISFAQALTDEARHRREGTRPGPDIQGRLRIVVSTDASVGVLSKGCDLVIIGADRISEDGHVSNKTGSLPAVLTNKEITNGSAAVICISEAEKIAPPGSADEHAEEDNDKGEVISTWKLNKATSWEEMVTVRNVYFEWVPAQYIDYYVCEEGVLTRDEIKRKSGLISDLTAEVFADLQVI